MLTAACLNCSSAPAASAPPRDLFGLPLGADDQTLADINSGFMLALGIMLGGILGLAVYAVSRQQS